MGVKADLRIFTEIKNTVEPLEFSKEPWLKHTDLDLGFCIFLLDLKSRLASGGGATGGTSHVGDSAASNEKISILEKKLYALQEELTELHRRRSENAQQIIDQVRLTNY